MLNSKTEFNRSKIGRLTIGDEEERRDRELRVQESIEEEEGLQGWERNKALDRRVRELSGRVDLEKGLRKSPARNRDGDHTGERSTKKWKYPLLEENWGEETTANTTTTTPTTPLVTNNHHPRRNPRFLHHHPPG